MTEQSQSATHTATEQPQQQESGLAIASLVLGIVSMVGPGLLLGIPAIITGAIALKKKLAGRGLAIAGLITGIVSTVLSLLFLAFIIAMICIGLTVHPDGYYDQPMPGYYHMQS